MQFFRDFDAHAVNPDLPFISETGYRSFLGFCAEMPPGTTPDVLAREMIQAFIDKDCKGKLKKIERSYVEREMARRAEKPNYQKERDS